MKDQELVNALRRLRVETGSLACMGCGHEHNCGVSGCAIINEAVARITMLDESFGEGSVLKMAAAVLETTPEELLQSTRFRAGDTVWVLCGMKMMCLVILAAICSLRSLELL